MSCHGVGNKTKTKAKDENVDKVYVDIFLVCI